MANYICNVAEHQTLTASTVDTVTLNTPTTSLVVVNRTGTAEIYFTVGLNAIPTAPTVGGTNTYVVPAIIGSLVITVPIEATLTVSLISSGVPAYSVEALS